MLTIDTNVSEEMALPYKYLRILEKDLFLFREVSSTNSIAQHMARSGAIEGTIVLSSSQTSGMGRMKRQWACPAGQGILMSMILRPKINVQLIPQLTLLCGVAVAETIRKTTGCEAGIKWPNDIVIGGKKVCGILAQSSFSGHAPLYVIMGVGINVNQTYDQLPPDCRETGTSLKLELGQKFSRLRLLEKFIILWDEHYKRFIEEGHSFLRTKWIANNVTLGREVNINKGNDLKHGLAVDISERGGLIIDFPDGSSEEFLAEDLSLGRTHYGGDTK
ncbi:biotin--[acetyl-CoA-carboxylase] ligase [Desulfosporosinus metallidurans]|uniref:biotin--[biotin carboxyl-carrier protein] ligase n=1 Tax=Desulfosporosinus metallidurans TaxID=1888891 RepID=A0A1Q8QS69_9FIRM|nr:biotin--[acetyl-CoA-carboxylase] ligase [Desulfosporosinus metallidurans]OLN30194.1 Biotin operon repressor / Biotin-protein ligase [Desulfosporosinus metallidurans]